MNKGNEQVEVVKGGLLRRAFSRPPLDFQKKSFKDQNQVDLTQTPSMVLTLRVEQSKGELLGREVLGGGKGGEGNGTYSVSSHIAADVFHSFLLHN